MAQFTPREQLAGWLAGALLSASVLALLLGGGAVTSAIAGAIAQRTPAMAPMIDRAPYELPVACSIRSAAAPADAARRARCARALEREHAARQVRADAFLALHAQVSRWVLGAGLVLISLLALLCARASRSWAGAEPRVLVLALGLPVALVWGTLHDSLPIAMMLTVALLVGGGAERVLRRSRASRRELQLGAGRSA